MPSTLTLVTHSRADASPFACFERASPPCCTQQHTITQPHIGAHTTSPPAAASRLATHPSSSGGIAAASNTLRLLEGVKQQGSDGIARAHWGALTELSTEQQKIKTAAADG
jgi:hypothetical protein